MGRYVLPGQPDHNGAIRYDVRVVHNYEHLYLR